MNNLKILQVIILAANLVAIPMVQGDPYQFEDQAQRERFDSLLEELRCLVCQNQSLADSGAGLADDLREEVYRMVTNGENNHAIKTFMVQRYGNFVLYDPPLNPSTVVLWFAPITLVVFSLAVIVFLTRKNQSRKTDKLKPMTPRD